MIFALAHHEQHHLAARAESYRRHDAQFARWAAGFGVIRSLDTGRKTRGLGYCNRGGTLNLPGMLFANRCTWLHILSAVADLTAAALGVVKPIGVGRDDRSGRRPVDRHIRPARNLTISIAKLPVHALYRLVQTQEKAS